MDGFKLMRPPKTIPLICTVCPESPRFSDVSHLLTHIASKGHLHHETQTKLKAHQDLVSAVALQQYEQWYQDNGIEVLLVERLKAKQAKEALKGRRPQAKTSSNQINSLHHPKKRSRRAAATAASDANDYPLQNYAESLPIYPGLFSEENDNELPDDALPANDMMSLKGQIWPGMGKMDLANDDMKRTRNQRKPKSAIERMRRTSEGIEPTQVVMTSDFEVERIKGVYDSSSPIPGQEEEPPPPPKRAARTKRKREPLSELSVNIPIGHSDPANSTLLSRNSRQSRRGARGAVPLFDPSLTQRPPILSHSIFKATSSPMSVYNDTTMDSSSHQHSKTLYYDHHAMHSINPISQPTLSTHLTTSHDSIPYSRDSSSGLPDSRQPSYSSHLSHRPDTSSSLSSSIFGGSSRLSMVMNDHFAAYDRFQYQDTHPITPKHDEYLSLTGQVSLLNSSPNFINLSENNPLLSQDRPVLKSYPQSPTCKSHSQEASFAGFKPLNYSQDIADPSEIADSQEMPTDDIKVESQLCDIVHSSIHHENNDDSTFDNAGNWAPDGMLETLSHELSREDSDT